MPHNKSSFTEVHIFCNQLSQKLINKKISQQIFFKGSVMFVYKKENTKNGFHNKEEYNLELVKLLFEHTVFKKIFRGNWILQ